MQDASIDNKYAVSGTGVIGAFGTDLNSLQNFDDDKSPPEPLVADTAILEKLNPNINLRRTDQFSRLALTASILALKNAQTDISDISNYGLIVATGYGAVTSTCGFKDSFINNSSLGASPTFFTKSVHNQAASQLSMQLGIRGPIATVCQHYFPFQMALQLAGTWLSEKRVSHVIIGGVDEYPSFLQYCRKRYLSQARTNTANHLTSSAMTHSEGSAFFILEKADATNSITTISLPTFAKHAEQVKPNEDNEWTFIRTLDSIQAFQANEVQDKRKINPKEYGSFPTVAALDLATLIHLTKNNKSQFIEQNGDNALCQINCYKGDTCA